MVNQKLARRVLEKQGHAVTVATNGQEVLDLVAETEFDLILMDCQMPVLDGYQATMKIRLMEASTGQHIPIIALTANALSEERDSCLEAGMDDFVSKPFKAEQLADAIRRTIHGAQSENLAA